MAGVRIGLLASHQGSNAQSVMDACASGRIDGCAVVISNNSDSGALARARSAGIPTSHISGMTHPDLDERDRAICNSLRVAGADLVVLAGYMKRLGPHTLTMYAGRVLNVHPALLPKFGGQGMYGLRVHAAVLDAGEARTGATVHLVDGEYDHGAALGQREIPVMSEDTATSLADRVLEIEHDLLVDTIAAIASGTLRLPSPPCKDA